MFKLNGVKVLFLIYFVALFLLHIYFTFGSAHK